MKFKLLLFILTLYSTVVVAHKNDGTGSFPFTENAGQWNKDVLFKSDVNGGSIFFEKNAFHYQFIQSPNYHLGNVPKDDIERGHIFKATFLNANENIIVEKSGVSNYYYNYFIGNDESKWQNTVRSYQQISYQNLYNGIDLEVYKSKGFLKYDYVVSPNALTSQIKIKYDGVKQPALKDGNLIITHSLGELIEEKPYAYQVVNGNKRQVACNYAFNENGELFFEFPEGYDNNLSLTIDPVLVFSTYSGSTANNFGETATYDDLGNGYMGGIASAIGYNTTTGAFQRTYAGGNWDIAISKFNPSGSSLIYSTFLGGRRNETAHSMVVDQNNNLFVLGASGSEDFPTTRNGYDTTLAISTSTTTELTTFAFGVDIIITKFNSTGTQLLGSTYFGGAGVEGINANPIGGSAYDGLNFNYGDSHRGEIVTDSIGNCYIGSVTSTPNLSGVFGSLNGSQDGIVLKFNPNLSNLTYGRYVGGSGLDAVYSLKVIDSNKVLIGGGTTSFVDFPTTTGSYQETSNQNTASTQLEADGFIAIISSNGRTIEKSTYISTPNYDQVYFVEFDRFNNAYAFGQTAGGVFPIVRAPRADIGAGQFIVKLDRNLDSLEFSTTFGNGLGTGEINISPTAFLVDKCQNIYTSGWGGNLSSTNGEGSKTLPSNMLVTNNSDPSIPSSTSSTDNNDFYLYVVNRTVDSVLYASFFGGTSSEDHVDGGTSRFDKNGVIYHSVCGSCGNVSSDFPTTSSAYSNSDNSFNGCNNALFKLDFEIVIRADFTANKDEICLKPGAIDSAVITNRSVGATNITWDFSGDTVVSKFEDTTIYFTQPGMYTIRQVVFDSICAIGDFLNDSILVRPDNIEIDIEYDSVVCYSNRTQIVTRTNGKANRFRYSQINAFNNPINGNLNDSVLAVTLLPGNNVFYVLATNPTTNACEKQDSIVIFYSPTNANASVSANTVCEGTPLQFNANVTNADDFQWVLGNGSSLNALNPSFTYPSPGSYNAYFVYENQLCQLKDSIPFTLNVIDNDLQITNPGDSTFCGSGDLVVSLPSSGTITSYQYSSNRDFSNTLNSSPTTNSITINGKDSTLYYIKISNSFCELTDSIFVQYIPYDFDLNNLTDSACLPHSEAIQATILGADSFQISISDGQVFKNNTTPSVQFNQAGTFQVKLLTENQQCGRKDSITKTITILENVELVPIADTLVCEGVSVELKSNSLGSAANFIWSTSPTFNSLITTSIDSILNTSPDVTTTYYVRGQNFRCSAVDTVTLNIENLKIDVNDFRSFCIFDTISLDATVTQASSPLQYSWTPKDSILLGDNLISAIIAPKTNQFFYLRTLSQTGCEDFDTVEVEVNLPAFDDAVINGTDSLFKGQETQLSTNRNGSNLIYEWEPAEDLDNPNSPNPNATLNTSKTYKVTITDLNTGCTVTALRRLNVFEVNCSPPDIFIPTAFSPNGDLANDVLYVRGANIRELEFQLFNRWGELIFETNEINKGWNGTYKGKKVDPGVFVYQIKAICFDGQEYVDKGNITLLK